MKAAVLSVLAALTAQQVAGHAIFQDLWINGVDTIIYQSTCVRMPTSNSPITDVTSNNIRCNINTKAPGTCPVVAGQTVTVEMHQQPGDRSCGSEAIGGAHYGPVQVYLSKVTSAATADGSSGWFKIFADTWSHVASGSSGDDDNWGTKDLNTCCGRMNVKIPSDIPAGDYLLRAEVIALHTAGSSGGAQFYVSCYQLTISGGGSASPALVSLPGAYKASDPGILVNIHAAMSTYIAPGPTVYAGGSTKSAGAACAGVETGTAPGPTYTLGGGSGGGTSSATSVVGGGGGTTLTTSSKPATSTPASGGGSAPLYGQCGGQGWTGPTTCASGTCKASSVYYSQCLP